MCSYPIVIIPEKNRKPVQPLPVSQTSLVKSPRRIFCICHLCCNSICLPLIQRVTILLLYILSQRLKNRKPKCCHLLFGQSSRVISTNCRHRPITVVRPFHIHQCKAFTPPYKINIYVYISLRLFSIVWLQFMPLIFSSYPTYECIC